MWWLGGDDTIVPARYSVGGYAGRGDQSIPSGGFILFADWMAIGMLTKTISSGNCWRRTGQTVDEADMGWGCDCQPHSGAQCAGGYKLCGTS